MATKKADTPRFSATVKIVTIVEVDLSASTFEAAIEEGKRLKETDVLDIHGSFCDGAIRVLSVTNSSVGWDT
jgi:hypothetical protein